MLEKGTTPCNFASEVDKFLSTLYTTLPIYGITK